MYNLQIHIMILIIQCSNFSGMVVDVSTGIRMKKSAEEADESAPVHKDMN